MAKYTTVGIDCGTRMIRIVATETDPKTGDFRVLGTGTSESRGIRHGYIVNNDYAVAAIRKAITDTEKSTGTAIKHAVVSVGGASLGAEIGQGTAIISKADNEVTTFDIEKAIKESEDGINLVNKRIIYMTPTSFRLDGKEILGRPEGMRGIKLEVKTLFVTCLAQHLEDLEAAILETGIEIVDIIPAPIAAAAVTLSERQKTVGCALVNIGAETTSIAVFENNILVGMHTFAIGSADITNDIALGLKISLDEAENIKTGSMTSNSISKRKLDDIIDARLSDIFELVESYLKKIKRSGLLPAGIVLTGGGTGIGAIEESAKTFLGLPARVGSIDESTVGKTKLRDSAWSVALGLCIIGRDRKNGGRARTDGDFRKKTKAFFVKLFEQFRP